MYISSKMLRALSLLQLMILNFPYTFNEIPTVLFSLKILSLAYHFFRIRPKGQVVANEKLDARSRYNSKDQE